MTTLQATSPQIAHETPLPLSRPAQRITSVDALRALVMLTMLFVNDVAGVDGIPWWMEHYHPSTANGMTFVDLVFPAFLFLVGLSIPLALSGRLSRGEPAPKILAHVLVRALSLILIGVLMVNMGSADHAAMGWRDGLWPFLSFTAVLLAFHSVPTGTPASRWISRAVRFVGFASLAYLALAFRRRGVATESSEWTQMRLSWYGILGLIGWTYLIGSALYLPFRRHRGVMLVLALVLLALWPLGRWGYLAWSHGWIDGGKHGSHAAITVAGVALAMTVTGPSALPAARSRIAFALSLVLGATALAVLTHDAYGINKNAATPAWCCWAVAITAAIWIPLHVLLDAKTLPAPLAGTITHYGANVLLAYILSSYFNYFLQVTGLTFYDRLGSNPGTGIPRAFAFAFLLLSLTAVLDRFRVRLKV